MSIQRLVRKGIRLDPFFCWILAFNKSPIPNQVGCFCQYSLCYGVFFFKPFSLVCEKKQVTFCICNRCMVDVQILIGLQKQRQQECNIIDGMFNLIKFKLSYQRQKWGFFIKQIFLCLWTSYGVARTHYQPKKNQARVSIREKGERLIHDIVLTAIDLVIYPKVRHRFLYRWKTSCTFHTSAINKAILKSFGEFVKTIHYKIFAGNSLAGLSGSAFIYKSSHANGIGI